MYTTPDFSPANVYRREARRACVWVAGLALLAGASRLLPEVVAFRGLANYAPLHTLLEVAAIAMAVMVFAIAWTTQQYRASRQGLVAGLAFLGVALLDLSHVLSYQGMPDFVTPSSPEKAINFWLAARTLALMALLYLAFARPAGREQTSLAQRLGWLAALLLLVALVQLWLLLWPQWLPRTFIAGQGLMPFKIHAEYALMAGHLLAALGIARRARRDGTYGYLYLCASSLIMGLGEYFFTLYTDVSDLYNLLGHLYKVIGYGFLYRALFADAVHHPYRSLSEARARLQATMAALPDALYELDRNGVCRSAGPRAGSALSARLTVGALLDDVLPATAAGLMRAAMTRADRQGQDQGTRISLALPEGERHFELSLSCRPDGYLVLSRDVTGVVENERRILHETALNRALLAIHGAGQDDEPALLSACAGDLEQLTASPLACLHVYRDEGSREALLGVSDRHAGSARVADLSGADGGCPWLPAVAGEQVVDLDAAALPAALAGMGEPRGLGLTVRDNGRIVLVASLFGKAGPYLERDGETLRILAASLWHTIKQRRQDLTIYRLSKALEQNPYPIIITDAEVRIKYVNEAFVRVSGYRAEEVLGRNPRMLKSGQTDRQTYVEMWDRLQRGDLWKGELVNRRRDGSCYTERAVIYPVMDGQGRIINYVAHKEDITRQKADQARIRELSQFDQLTGLLNKAAFENQLRARLARARELALLWMDLDNFKSVNDSLGYLAGDELLVEVSNRIRALFGPQALIGRHDGDGFLISIDSGEQERLALLAGQLIEKLQQPLSLGGGTLSVSASLGIAIHPDDAKDAVTLIKAAEMAMYQVKRDGRNGLRFYAPHMQRYSERALALSSALKQAIAGNELSLAFQPQLDLASGRPVGAEALLRWQHPQWGPVSPAEFIPLAEQSGLIVSIGWWVIEQAMAAALRLYRAGLTDMVIAVNVSALQFVQPDFVEELSRRRDRLGLPAGAIEIELTESVALLNPEEVGLKLSALSAAGMRLSIDDFGTGYSSMSYLKRFSVDKLKIDKSFIDELNDNEEDRAIVSAIIQMARSLGMKTIAEGVELAAQAERLRALGCDEIQGYWYSRPLGQEAFDAFMADATRALAAGTAVPPGA
ncbi:EAL domain-containing protein [Zobellella taiwanensis]